MTTNRPRQHFCVYSLLRYPQVVKKSIIADSKHHAHPLFRDHGITAYTALSRPSLVKTLTVSEENITNIDSVGHRQTWCLWRTFLLQ